MSARSKSKWRLANPAKAVFQILKNNASRRGKVFTLPYAEFLEICITTDYLAKRGRGKDDLTLDRIIDSLGYISGNVRVITKSENSKRRFFKAVYTAEERRAIPF